MKPRSKRALAIVAGVATLGVATALVLNAFQSNLVFFFSPTQVASKEAPVDRAFRVGGLVVTAWETTTRSLTFVGQGAIS